MASLTLRRVGGSVVATIPKTLLELLNAKEGDTVEYTFDDGKLIIESRQKRRRTLPKYDLNQLLEEQKLIQAELDKTEVGSTQSPPGVSYYEDF